jgi:hypothetical protein
MFERFWKRRSSAEKPPQEPPQTPAFESPDPLPSIEAELAALEKARNGFRQEAILQLTVLARNLCRTFAPLHFSASSADNPATISFYRPEEDEPLLQVVVKFTDQSESAPQTDRPRWNDEFAVSLLKPGQPEKQLAHRIFYCYEGTLARRPLPWQLQFKAAHYERRTGTSQGTEGSTTGLDAQADTALGLTGTSLLQALEQAIALELTNSGLESKRPPASTTE